MRVARQDRRRDEEDPCSGISWAGRSNCERGCESIGAHKVSLRRHSHRAQQIITESRRLQERNLFNLKRRRFLEQFKLGEQKRKRKGFESILSCALQWEGIGAGSTRIWGALDGLVSSDDCQKIELDQRRTIERRRRRTRTSSFLAAHCAFLLQHTLRCISV